MKSNGTENRLWLFSVGFLFPLFWSDDMNSRSRVRPLYSVLPSEERLLLLSCCRRELSQAGISPPVRLQVQCRLIRSSGSRPNADTSARERRHCSFRKTETSEPRHIIVCRFRWLSTRGLYLQLHFKKLEVLHATFGIFSSPRLWVLIGVHF